MTIYPQSVGFTSQQAQRGPASKVGICGSDMAYWSKGMAGGFVPLDFSHGDARFAGHPGASGRLT